MSTALKILLTVALVVVCVFLFVGTYLLNKNTKKPEGCDTGLENCDGCEMCGCANHPSKINSEENNGTN